MGTPRIPVFAANWKMNLLRADALGYVARIRAELPPGERRVLLLPPFLLIPEVAAAVGGDPRIAVGGQDLHPEDAGAYTGDVSGRQLRDAGCGFVLCGHSERRADHRETDEMVGAKLRAAQHNGLGPVLCIGESLAERDAGSTAAVLARQLDAALGGAPPPALDGASPPAWGGASQPPGSGLVVAYEPVWAIGSGRTATPAIAQESHAFVRRHLARRLGGEVATAVPILYGGSVKPDNCAALFGLADIDGFLIGGASLDPGSFLDIIGRCGPSAPEVFS